MNARDGIRAALEVARALLVLVGPLWGFSRIVTGQYSVMSFHRDRQRTMRERTASSREQSDEPGGDSHALAAKVDSPRPSGAGGEWPKGSTGRWHLSPRSTPLGFLSKSEIEKVMSSIRIAERASSAEFRVHIERRFRGEMKRRVHQVFESTGMKQTRRNCGILLYVALAQRRFMVIGDEGIPRDVGYPLWDEARDILVSSFRVGEFAEGLCKTIEHMGSRLQRNFPLDRADRNELPDELSMRV